MIKINNGKAVISGSESEIIREFNILINGLRSNLDQNKITEMIINMLPDDEEEAKNILSMIFYMITHDKKIYDITRKLINMQVEGKNITTIDSSNMSEEEVERLIKLWEQQ